MRSILLILLLVSTHAYGSRSAGAVIIDGVDQYCNSFTPTVSSLNTIYTCVGSQPAGGPTNCSATVNGAATVNFSAAGGTANLHVACDQTTGITYNWRRNGSSGFSFLANFSDVLPSNATPSNVNYTYQVTPCIGANCVTVPASPLTATVAATGSFSGSCPGFANTYVVTMPWLSSTRQIQPMGPNDIIVVQFTTGSTTISTNLPKINMVEYGSPPSSRFGTLSPTPCDFSQQPAFSANVGPSNSMSIYFAVGPTPGVFQGYYALLQTNTTYYFNVKNVLPSSCQNQGVCQMSIDLLGTR